jgi:dimethylargininase
MEELEDFRQIVVDPDETYSANILWINGTLIVPAGYPKTRRKLAALGLPIIELDTSEARLMDGGLTCMSLRF